METLQEIEAAHAQTAEPRRTGRLVLLLIGIGLTFWFFKILALTPENEDFLVLPEDPDVLYESDTQALAQRLSSPRQRAMESLEARFGVHFLRPPVIYVCGTSCKGRIPVGSAASVAISGDALFMTAGALNQSGQIRPVTAEQFLKHELVQVLLRQHLGFVAYRHLPAWFREGLSSLMSDHAGAEACTPANAARHILSGQSFDPADSGSLLSFELPKNKPLKPYVFRREAEMFLQYLQDHDPAAFSRALHAVIAGKDVQESFRAAYGQAPQSYWQGFLDSLEPLLASAE